MSKGARETKDDDTLKVVGQITGYRNLKLAGGLRVEIDFFEAREEDILQMVLLGNRKAVVEIEIRPYDEEGPSEKEARDKE